MSEKEASKTGASKTGASKTGASKTGASKTGASKTEASKTDDGKGKESKKEASKTDASKTDDDKGKESKTDASKTDASKTDASKTGDDGEGKESKTDAEGKCLPGKTCIFKSLSEKYIQEGNVFENISKEIAEAMTKKIYDLKDRVKEDLTFPSKCAKEIVSILPTTDGIQKAIDNMFDSIAEGFNKIGKSAEYMKNNVTGMVLDDEGWPDFLAPFKIVAYSAVKDVQDRIGNFALGDKWHETLNDPKLKPDELLADILKTSDSYKKLIDNPKFQDIFKEWIDNYAGVLDEAIELGRPAIKGVEDKATEVINDTSKRIGDALTKSLSEIVSSAVKAVPVVGIPANAAFMTKTIGENLQKVCEPALTKGGIAAAEVINTAVKYGEQAKCELDNLKKKMSPLLEKSQNGGSCSGMSVERKRKNINKATKRLKRMLSRFTRRRTKPINYAKYINKARY